MSDRDSAVAAHNEARHSAPGQKRPDLTWDNGLANDAEQYAKHLADTKTFEHSHVSGQGENLFMSSGNASLTDATKAWLGEKPNYNGQKIPDGNFGSYGHYTQCIWPTTLKVGLAAAKASNGATYIVGRYSPPGNWMGETAYGSEVHAMASATSEKVKADHSLMKVSELPTGHKILSALQSHEGGYVVMPGDSLYAIAKKLGVDIEALKAANSNIKGPAYEVTPGQTLSIPGHEGGAPQAGGSGGKVNYSGPSSNFPSPNKWISWEALSSHNAQLMNKYSGNSTQETQWVIDAVAKVSGELGLDKRGILAVVMQESGGKVRVGSTVSPGAGVKNTGIMQAHNGSEFNEHDAQGSIIKMVHDGVGGVPGPSGDGYLQLEQRYHDFFIACRGYNSGDGGIDKNNLSAGFGATNSYCSDIANRLMGVDPN